MPGIGAYKSVPTNKHAARYAEDAHQQYLAENPMGYCGLGGTGVGCRWAHSRLRRESDRMRATCRSIRRR